MSEEVSPESLLSLPRSIRDPIHGTIHLSNEEVGIIDHPLFRRLHSIKQNGLLYLVFPSSTHTRFEHSLGVLHVADEAFRSLLRNSYVAEDKQVSAVETVEDAENGQAVAFHQLDRTLLSDLLRIVRLAALAHDLGHGPFSHHFDSFAPKRKEVADAIETGFAETSYSISPLAEKIRGSDENGGRVEHEEMSCFFFAHIWKSLCDNSEAPDGEKFTSDEVPSLVTAVILGMPELIRADHTLRRFIPLLNDLVASGPVDADRMDYLERDSRSAGVTYGFYDRERLLKSFLVYKERPEGEDHTSDTLRLGIKQSGLRAVENFVQARFELFVQIYYHKTNRATQLMLSEIAKIADEGDVSVTDLGDRSENIPGLYCDLTDERFLRILMGEDEKYLLPETEGAEKIERIAKRISQRNLWKRVYEGSPGTTCCIFEHLIKEHGSDELYRDEVLAKATKDLDKGARLLIRADSNRYEAVEHTDWLAESPMMQALADEEDDIARIYFKRSDADVRKEMRNKARSFAHKLNRAGR